MPDIDLDSGETAALAVASEQSTVFLTDDLAARDAATDLGVEVHGSIGVIVFAYSCSEINRARAIELMRSLQQETSLFITDSVVERGIAMLEETS